MVDFTEKKKKQNSSEIKILLFVIQLQSLILIAINVYYASYVTYM